MTQTLIHNTTIVTADDANTVYEDAALVIESDRIADMGSTTDVMRKYPAAERIDGRYHAVMPGFANLHTHLSLTLARGIFEDFSAPNAPPFDAGAPRPPLPQLSPDEHRVMCLLGAVEAIRSGTTLVLEDGVGIQRYAQELHNSGLRLQLCERTWDRANGPYGTPGPFELDPTLADASLTRLTDLHTSWHNKGNGRVQVGIAAWSPDMCSPDLLRTLRELQDQRNIPATIHLNQLWGEVAAVQQQRGVRPTEYLAQCDFLSERLLAAHCRCMTPHEEQLLSASGAVAVFNAAMAARRGLSPRIDELEAGGCTIVLGTDNMAEDMVETMRTGMFMERIRRQDGRQPTPNQVFTWATRNGYRALGLPDGGWLAPGNKADVILVNLRRAHLVPLVRVVSNFVHQGQARDIVSVMVDGQWLMRDGVILTLDEDDIIDEANRIGRTAWKHVFDTYPAFATLPGVAVGFSKH